MLYDNILESVLSINYLKKTTKQYDIHILIVSFLESKSFKMPLLPHSPDLNFIIFWHVLYGYHYFKCWNIFYSL